ncbi:MAG: DUF547 domain-containing protein [Bacteroidota bacterium]
MIPTHTWAQESSDREAEICPAIDHSQWNELLKKYVDTKGNVAYKAFAEEEQKLTAYLNYLDSNAPSQDCSVNTRLSYYINLYNAATVKLIIDNYPLNSIKDIKNPWSKKRVLVGGKKYSLGYIEHKILRKMNEPRIHFAINCASYSCPKLIDQAFLSETMETQLEAATKDFVNDPSRNEISPEKIQLSAIFKWYKGDFIKNGRLIEYIDHYSRTKATEGTKISYLTYDWGLNEAR